MKYKKILLLIFLSIFVYEATFSYADLHPQALKGLKIIKVEISGISKDAIKLGITEERLKTLTELKLRSETRDSFESLLQMEEASFSW